LLAREKVGGKELLRVETVAGEEVTVAELWSVTDKGVLRHRVTRGDADPFCSTRHRH
jgi:hypothetical protein